MNHVDLSELLKLKRLNTPTIYNGWEQITKHDASKDGFNPEPVHDFMPQMGPMIGYAVTVIIEPSNPEHPKSQPNAWSDYRQYIALQPGPKIVIVQDLDKPKTVGAFWGEVNSNVHKALGCVGTIIDGAIRDVDEMCNAGFKAIAKHLCVGHAFSHPVKWNCEVEVFGRKIVPGQLIHADKHGFLAIPLGEEKGLLDAAAFMDANECNTLMGAARQSTGKPTDQIIEELNMAGRQFQKAVKEKFGRKGEWS
jgi:regulator of RNase E activity RraA